MMKILSDTRRNQIGQYLNQNLSVAYSRATKRIGDPVVADEIISDLNYDLLTGKIKEDQYLSRLDWRAWQVVKERFIEGLRAAHEAGIPTVA